jgi:uncharacterized membrane protein YfcA
VNDKLEPSEMVAASSSLLLLNGAGAAVGPVLAGSLIGRFGPDAYYATLGTLTGALTVYDLWRKMRRRPPETKRPYVNAAPSLGAERTVTPPLASSQPLRDDA